MLLLGYNFLTLTNICVISQKHSHCLWENKQKKFIKINMIYRGRRQFGFFFLKSYKPGKIFSPFHQWLIFLYKITLPQR